MSIETLMLREQEEIIKELNDVADSAFGNDYSNLKRQILEERVHALGCGCGQCNALYTRHLDEAATLFARVQPEDIR